MDTYTKVSIRLVELTTPDYFLGGVVVVEDDDDVRDDLFFARRLLFPVEPLPVASEVPVELCESIVAEPVDEPVLVEPLPVE